MLDRIKSLDDKILDKISRKHTPALNYIMISATRLGNFGSVWFVFAIPFLFFRQWRLTGWTLLIALFFSWFLSEIAIKHIVGRMRPCHNMDEKELLIKPQSEYSFPSSHAATSFAITIVTALLSPLFLPPILILACFISYSRMYLLAHYPTDVFCGIVLGVVCGFAAIPIASAIPFFNW